MIKMNHYEANREFRFVYSQMEDHLQTMEAYLTHMHSFITTAEDKLGDNLEFYSQDFFDYFYAGAYGETFRSSFIVTISSICEGYIKEYISAWKNVLQTEFEEMKWSNSILDLLKEADKVHFKVGIDFSRKEIVDFRGLLAVRNAMVHSRGTTEYVTKYIPLISQLAKSFPSLELSADGFLYTSEQFCKEAMFISRRFFFYITKLAIRKFPDYRLYQPLEDDF